MSYNKETDMWEGYIYCITNKVNGKQYIGQTILTIEHRWRAHINSAKRNLNNLYLYTAMEKYDVNNFSIKELVSKKAKTKKKIILILNTLEVEYIKEYNTLKPNGYNMCEGGNNLPNTWSSKEVYQFDMEGNYISKYNSVAEASSMTGIMQSDISNCSLGKLKSAGLYIWRYRYDPPKERYISRTNKVKQFDIHGNLIKIWNSIEDASISLNNINSIAYIMKCCKGLQKSHAKYIWRFIEDEYNKYPLPLRLINPISKTRPKRKLNRKVMQLSLNMELINIYNNVSEVVSILHINRSALYKALNNKSKTSDGFIWKYAS